MSGALPSAGPSAEHTKPAGAGGAIPGLGAIPQPGGEGGNQPDPCVVHTRRLPHGPSRSASAFLIPVPDPWLLSELPTPPGQPQPRAGHHDPARCVPGGPDPWQPRDVNHKPGAAAGSPASPASCLSPALAAPPLAFGFAPRKAPRANERCLGTARSHRGPLRCHRPAPICPQTPLVLGGLAGRAEPLPQLLEGLPTPQQDPRAPPEVLAAGSRGGREGLHSPDGSAPTCGAISHWGGQLVTGGASLLGGGAGNGHGDTKYCCHGPKIRSGSQRYRTDTGQAALPWHSQPSPGAPAPNPPVCCQGGQLSPAAGMESCLPRCHCWC